MNAPIIKAIVLDTWAGRRYYAVEVVGETPKKFRVRILTANGITLPGRRFVEFDDVVLVPKHAIADLPAEYKVEQAHYEGHLYGYGGSVDAKR